MKKLVLLVTAALCSLSLGQDTYKVDKLTSSPSLECFPSWSPDGKFIVYSFIATHDSPEKTGLWKLSFDTKETVQIFNEIAEHPKISPDGKYIVFDADSGKSIKMIPSGGGTPENIIPDTLMITRGGLPCWSPDGSKIAFIDGRTISLCVMDINTRRVQRVFQKDGFLPIPGCWTKDGTSILVALRDFKTSKSTIWKVSDEGTFKEQITGHNEGLYRFLELSPDGSVIVYAVYDGKRVSLWIMPAEGGNTASLMSTTDSFEAPCWSPDGRFMIFNFAHSGNCDIGIIEVNPAQLKEKLLNIKQ